MSLFKPGQLVKLSPLLDDDDRLKLYDVPGGVTRIDEDPTHVTGWLESRDVALVVGKERTDGGSVYVLGPHGGGWADGAMLQVIRL